MNLETKVDLLWFLTTYVLQHKHHDNLLLDLTSMYYVIMTYIQYTKKQLSTINTLHHILTPLVIQFYKSKIQKEELSKMIVYYNTTIFFLLLAKEYQTETCGKYFALITIYLWIKYRFYETYVQYKKNNNKIILIFLSMNIYWFVKILHKVKSG